ncbi:hypothetical protein SMICM304S_05975 [Streptomyces microflavus]
MKYVVSEPALPEVPERHVRPQDVAFGAVRVGDRVERQVRVGGFLLVGELHVVELGTADDAFLLLHGERVPRGQVVQVLLYDDIAAALELRVLRADERRRAGVVAHRVLRTVHETEQVPVVR